MAPALRALKLACEEAKIDLSRGDTASIVGFGTFKVRARAARRGLNPATKEAIDIPAGKAPAFTAGKKLKDAVR